MDKYKELQCIRGLLFSLEEQINRIEHASDLNRELKEQAQKTTVEQYHEAIIKFLMHEEE